MPDTEENTLLNIASRLHEHYGDYLVAVRLKDGGHMWRCSDVNWSSGIVERIKNKIYIEDQGCRE